MNRLSWSQVASQQNFSPDQMVPTRCFSQPVGGHLAALAYRIGVSPNQLTLIGLMLMLAASLVYIQAWEFSLLIAGLLWQLGFAFDCADGQLARAIKTAGPVGAWLDVSCDYLRQTAISFAILWYLLDAGMLPQLAWLSCFLLLSGMSVYLFTATLMKVEKPPAIASSGRIDQLRTVLRFVMDTPLFLLLICLFAPLPWLLCVYTAFYGALLLLRSISIIRMRLAV